MEYDIDNTLNPIQENGGYLNNNDKEYCYFEKTINCNVQSQGLPTNACSEDLKIILPITPPSTPLQADTARKRWRILANVVRKTSEKVTAADNYNDEQMASVRSFKSFNLLHQDIFKDRLALKCLGESENWYKYTILLGSQMNQEFFVNIFHVKRNLSTADLTGFNNTGNICVWPSEEALTAYVLSDLAAYSEKWILELGGGFTCLTGLMLAKYAKPCAVHLTDGNEISVENLRKSVCLNDLSCYMKCSVLKWEDVDVRLPSEASKFDFILSADCLFFDDARLALIDTIWYYLSDFGTALIMAPRRGKTMAHFIQESITKGFIVTLTEKYNEIIWNRHLKLKECLLYKEDLHYPVLLNLKKH